MAEDRSLDDFAEPDGEEPERKGPDGNASKDTGRAGTESSGNDPGMQDDGDGSETDTDARIDPAISTSTWSTDGVACERCGDAVERRWRDGERFVCAGCKEW